MQIKKLDSIAIKDLPKASTGIATGIVKDGQIVYEKYAGYADLSDSTFIDKKSRFNIASNGKQFTALAILSLIENKYSYSPLQRCCKSSTVFKILILIHNCNKETVHCQK